VVLTACGVSSEHFLDPGIDITKYIDTMHRYFGYGIEIEWVEETT
jgi:hypothetical protein